MKWLAFTLLAALGLALLGLAFLLDGKPSCPRGGIVNLETDCRVRP